MTHIYVHLFDTQSEAEEAQHAIYLAAGLDAPELLTERWAYPTPYGDKWYVPIHPDIISNNPVEEIELVAEGDE